MCGAIGIRQMKIFLLRHNLQFQDLDYLHKLCESSQLTFGHMQKSCLLSSVESKYSYCIVTIDAI